MTDAFDSDVLIYVGQGHPLGAPVAARLAEIAHPIGSVLLLPEVLSKPVRHGAADEQRRLLAVLAALDLKPVDEEIADASVAFAARYGLRAVDAVHLATAVIWGAERFHTNNRKDFGPHIEEIEVVFPG